MDTNICRDKLKVKQRFSQIHSVYYENNSIKKGQGFPKPEKKIVELEDVY